MNASKLNSMLVNWTMNNSGIEYRDYLGMSAIGDCRLKLYTRMIQGQRFNLQDHLFCYEGYLAERDIIERLRSLDASALGPSQEFSDFGGRFQGHTDGSWDGDLLEVKSVAKTEWLPTTDRIAAKHYWQVQIYMMYGRYEETKMIYKARDTGQMRVVHIKRNHRVGEMARIKAQEILEAVDHRRPPECDCGRCINSNQ